MTEHECEECAYYRSFYSGASYGNCYAVPPVLSNPDLSLEKRGWSDPIVSGDRLCCRFFKEKEAK